MRLRFTRTAARQLDRVLSEISAESPAGGRHVQQRVEAALRLITDYPYVGRATERRDIRRLIVTPYPYVITYRVGSGEVVIRTLRHAARKPVF